MPTIEGWDVIGDIHGHAGELVKLLHHLGYEQSDTGYCHPSRKVVFLGDFIDGGEHLAQHRQVLGIVMNMVRGGHARAVMGNHEFNALAYHTQHNGSYLRERSDKNRDQHRAFLNEYDDDDDARREVLEFFFELPMWLEADGFRAIHACWDQQKIDYMKTLAPDGLLTPDLLVDACREGSLAYHAVEVLLKGFEVQLKKGITFRDKKGYERSAVRVSWWNSAASRLGEVHLPRDIDISGAADEPIPDTVPRYRKARWCYARD